MDFKSSGKHTQIGLYGSRAVLRHVSTYVRGKAKTGRFSATTQNTSLTPTEARAHLATETNHWVSTEESCPSCPNADQVLCTQQLVSVGSSDETQAAAEHQQNLSHHAPVLLL